MAPSDPNTVYAGTSYGLILQTNNAMAGSAAKWVKRGGLPPRFVTRIAVDPIDARTVYVSFSGFGLLDHQGHVFKTRDGGNSWTDISGDLPIIPVNDLALDPDLPDTLYAATDVGVMVTTNGGANWSALGQGLPRVAVFSLALHRQKRMLFAATHGRGAWQIAVPLPSLRGSPLSLPLTRRRSTPAGPEQR